MIIKWSLTIFSIVLSPVSFATWRVGTADLALQTRVPSANSPCQILQLVDHVQKHCVQHLNSRWWGQTMCRDTAPSTSIWGAMSNTVVSRPARTLPSPLRQNPIKQPWSNNPPGKVFPLRQVPDGKEGSSRYISRLPLLISTTCKVTHSKGLREDPEIFLNLIRGIFQIHDPTWADIQSLLNVFLMREEKTMVFSKAQEEAKRT